MGISLQYQNDGAFNFWNYEKGIISNDEFRNKSKSGLAKCG